MLVEKMPAHAYVGSFSETKRLVGGLFLSLSLAGMFHEKIDVGIYSLLGSFSVVGVLDG